MIASSQVIYVRRVDYHSSHASQKDEHHTIVPENSPVRECLVQESTQPGSGSKAALPEKVGEATRSTNKQPGLYRDRVFEVNARLDQSWTVSALSGG